MADAIVVAAVITLSECGASGTDSGIPLRVGRIDAIEAGPMGVPEAFTDLETTLATFAKAGFNQSEAIIAVACGHSLGGVHQIDHPEIVNASLVTSINTDGTDTFDSSPAVFDHIGINEYLQGTGKCGGPLVIGSNENTRSDLRLFSSDNNVTMESLATPESFKEKCAYIFERMLNTVPATVVLSDPILPMKWKLDSYQFNVSDDGVLSISGILRYLCGADQTCAPAPSELTYTYSTSKGSTIELVTPPFVSNPTDPFGDPVGPGQCFGNCCGTTQQSSFHGNQTQYSFSTNITAGTTALGIMDEYTYDMETDIMILGPSVVVQSGHNTGPNVATLSVAVLTKIVTDDSPVTLFITTRPSAQPLGALTALNVEIETHISATKTVGPYTIFSGSVQYPGISSGTLVLQAGLGGVWSTTFETFLNFF